MKNKKLFAILTLVCFMFTLMPVAAFAADGDVIKAVKGSKNVSSITITEDNDVDFVYNGEEDTEKGLFIVKDDKLSTTTDSMVNYVFEKPGTYEVYAADADDIAGIMLLNELKATKLALLKELETATENYVTVKVKPNTDVIYTIDITVGDDNEGADFDVTADGKTFKNDDVAEWDIEINANGGWDNDGHYTATLYKWNVVEEGEDVSYVLDGAVEDVELTFTEVGYADVVLADGAETDSNGEVAFEVVGDRTGDYKVLVKYGTKATATLNVSVNAEAVANVELVNAPQNAIDMEQGAIGGDIEFKFTDANGRPYESLADVRVVLTDKPADSTLELNEEGVFTLRQQDMLRGDTETDADGVYTLEGDFDEEGEYTIKVVLKNGKSASVKVKAAEMGDVTGIKFDVMNTARTVAYGEAVQFTTVLAYDAAGVTRNVTADTEFSANSPAVKEWNATNKFTVKDDDDYIGSAITVYAVHEDFTASTVVTVTDQATTISYADANAEVGVYTEVAGVVVDAAGNRVSIAGNGVADGTALVLEKPANAVAVADLDVDLKGNVTLNFLGSEKGTYKVLTTVSYTDADSAKKVYVSGTATIVVGAGEGTFQDVVVMSIGANKIVVNSEVKAIDAAPMIKDARTFVPFRALAEAFGAAVEFDAATQSVVAELNGVKVVMTIGSEAYTVNGVAKTADVAPFISDSRTMVPVRFVAEAFGITVTPIAAEDGSIADVLFTK